MRPVEGSWLDRLPRWVKTTYWAIAALVIGWILLAHALAGESLVRVSFTLPAALFVGLLWPITLPVVLFQILRHLFG